ncbi:BrnT family toxin [Sulfurospirillum barnesii]|uniref:BrnT family toxin n=1 Tax=Sulfurospirillum barnesii TaxID=44674 RepID=UPI00315A37E4
MLNIQKTKSVFILLGMSYTLKILTVVHCYRDHEGIIRIISARKSTKNEANQYKEFLS